MCVCVCEYIEMKAMYSIHNYKIIGYTGFVTAEVVLWKERLLPVGVIKPRTKD